MAYRPKYFGDAELHGQRQFCTDEILTTIDEFRKLWRAPILVSPVPGAVARFNAPRSKSQHSVDFWGDCNAVDLFPVGLDANFLPDWAKVVKVAQEARASGIGLYPQAKLGSRQGMVHLDCRHIRPGEDNTPANPASWSALRKRVGRGWKYGSISVIWDQLNDGVVYK